MKKTTLLLLSLLFSVIISSCGDGGDIAGVSTGELLGELLTVSPKNLQAQSGDGQVRLKWESQATSHRVHYATKSFTGVTPSKYTSLAGYNKLEVSSKTEAVIKPLVNGTKYYFVVTAVTNNIETAASNEVSITPAINLPTVTLSTNSPKTEGEEITFTAKLSDVLPNGYALNIQLGNGTGGFLQSVDMLASSNRTIFTYKTKATKIGSWKYQVAIFKGTAKQTYWQQGSYTIEAKAPNPPTGLHAIASNGAIALSWTGVDGATSYNIHQATETFASISDAANYSVLKGYKSYSSSVTSKKITGLTNGTKYYFVVTALKSTKYSLASNEVSQTPSETSGWVRKTTKAGFSRRYSHQAVVLNKKIYVIGGASGNKQTKKDVWSWSPSDVKTWKEETADAGFSARYGHQSVELNGRIYVIGGVYNYSNDDYENDVWSWSPSDGKTWKEETADAGFSGRYGHQAVVLNGRIYVIGGDTASGDKNDVWSSSDGKKWDLETSDAGFSARHGHQSVVLNGRIYVIGGSSDSGFKNDVWSSSDGKKWDLETSDAGFLARSSHRAVVLNGRMYVIGGWIGGTDLKNNVWSSANGKRWVEETSNAGFSARDRHQAVVLNGRIYVIGGYDKSNSYKSDVWYYEP